LIGLSNSGTATENAARYLRRRILSGDLPAGAPINQNDVAATVGVSRSPVRDAIQLLAAERLIVTRAHSTAVVAPLSLDDLEELYELRIALEPPLCKTALPNLTRVTVLEMNELMEAMESTEDMLVWLEANDRFHAAVYRRASRPRMVEIVHRARQQTGRYTRILVAELGTADSNDQHRRILDAVTNQDGPALERAVRDHLAISRDVILRHLYDKERDAIHSDGRAARPIAGPTD